MENEKFSINHSSPASLNYISSSPHNWKSSSGMDVQFEELVFLSEQPPPSLLSLNWENPMDQSVPLGSALSSIVSSPAASNSATVPAGRVIIKEVIGRLGSISNPGEISPSSQALGRSSSSYIGGNNNSANTSCFSTPLNSPPKLNLSMMDHQLRGNLPISGNSIAAHPSFAPFSADPGFAERAAKFSCFSNGNLGSLACQFGFPEPELPYRSAPRAESGKLSRVSSSQSLRTGSQMSILENKEIPLQDGIVLDRKVSRLSTPSTPEKVEFSNAREESSNSGQNTGGESASKGPNDINGRKRKAATKNKQKNLPSSPSAKDSKAVEDDDLNAKRLKPAEATQKENDEAKPKGEENSSGDKGEDCKKEGNESSKPPEPPKQDYIHVRARRGQATDSHSLAERVRREKISERMKFLQDLVPGCSKVTGKAVMLDEIINYVQSLQRQVEFLSMKLATINPRLDINMETLLSKNMLQSQGPLPHPMYPFDSSASMYPFSHQPQSGPPSGIVSNGSGSQCSVNPMDATLRRALSMPAIDGFRDAPQIPSLWDDDLHSVVQMGFGQNQETAFPSQNFHGPLPNGHMKIEL